MKKLKSTALLCGAISLAILHCAALGGTVEPSALFSDNAVLLKSSDTVIFGFASLGEKVSVSVAGASAEAIAGTDGRWIARIDLSTAVKGPHTMRIGDKTINNVIVGEVWLASGQSNMAFKMGSADDATEECDIVNPDIRCFLVGGGVEEKPNPRISGRWLLTGPAKTCEMTAVGYHFAKNLNTSLGVPVGIVESAIGASAIEAWCDPETMAVDSVGKAALDAQTAFFDNYREYERKCEAELVDWQTKFGRTDRRTFKFPPKTGWRELSGQEAESFRHGPGAVWLRRKVPSPAAGRPAEILRRRFIEKDWLFDTSAVDVFWNGHRLERSFAQNRVDKNLEYYRPDAGDVLAENTLEIRFFNAESIPSVLYSTWFGGMRLPYPGWSVCEEFSLPYPKAEERASIPPRQKFCLPQHWPSGLFNGKIAGLIPMSLSGIIWYQGETNASRPEEYESLFPAMIKSWRRLFGKPELPFAWCQLAGFHKKDDNADNPDVRWARLRMSQDRALRLPMTGQAVLIDVGEAWDIHPRDKRTPGARLAAWALNRVYGRKDLPYLGPRVEKVERAGDRMVVTFADCANGLVARDLGDKCLMRSSTNSYAPLVRNSPDAQVEGFSLCGADGKWFWADEATISGNTVVVSSKSVPDPVKVRYAYAENPVANLYNTDGFPAVPFGE